MKTIFIRADGGIFIGTGHIMRTLVLASKLRDEGYKVIYICRNDINNLDKYIFGINKVKENHFEVITINENNIIHDLKVIQIEHNANCLITDSYDVNESYFDKTKEIFPCTVYIDDLNFTKYNVDLLINQNAGIENFKYNVNKDCKLLLGTKYIILRDEFRNVKEKVINDKIENILITFGGADPKGVTLKLLKMLKDSDFKFHVVIGSAFKDKEAIKQIATNYDNIIIYEKAKMSKLMESCDMAIAAIGSSVYELLSVGTPTIGVISVDNQEALAKYLGEKGYIINLGWENDIYKDKLNEVISEVVDVNYRENLKLQGQKLVNKNGVYNIVNYIKMKI